MSATKWIEDDGGRTAAGFKGTAGDCVTRAIAIATGRPYADVYAVLAAGQATNRKTRKTRTSSTRRSARDGVLVKRKWFRDYMASLGWTWFPTMAIGSGCKVHLRAEELPGGRLIVSVSRHMVAVIDGLIHDTYDPSRDGTRCVYGYWQEGR